MGARKSKPPSQQAFQRTVTRTFFDELETYDQVSQHLQKHNVERIRVALFYDVTRSNTFVQRCYPEGHVFRHNLHYLAPVAPPSYDQSPDASSSYRAVDGAHYLPSDETLSGLHMNPYEDATYILSSTLQALGEEEGVYAFYFGDRSTGSERVAPLSAQQPCLPSLDATLQAYRRVVPTLKFYGGTSFVPAIRKTVALSQEHKSPFLGIILTDGAVDNFELNEQALAEASHHPVAFLVIGVGQGSDPDKKDVWDRMTKFDDDVSGRRFDNLQFVAYNQACRDLCASKHPGPQFAVMALQELPRQYASMRQLGYFN